MWASSTARIVRWIRFCVHVFNISRKGAKAQLKLCALAPLREIFLKLKLVKCLRFIWSIPILLLLATSTAHGQYHWRDKVDRLIEQADSLKLKHQRTFFLTKYIGTDRTYKETWYYTVGDDKIIEFEVRYFVDSVEHSETYYLNNGRPICMERYETVYFAYYEDEIKRGEVLFFQNGSVKQYVTVGPRNDNYSGFGEFYDSMQRFSDRYAELKKNIVATGYHKQDL
jgi:hypothetical protein